MPLVRWSWEHNAVHLRKHVQIDKTQAGGENIFHMTEHSIAANGENNQI